MALASTTHTLSLQLRIMGAKNVETKHKGNLFIRIYLSSTTINSSKSLHLDTKEIKQSSKKDTYLFWDETLSLECNGTNDSITKLRDDNLVVELRWRKSASFLGKASGSQLLGRAELPWKNVFDTRDMEIQKWVPLIHADSVLHIEEGGKPPALQLGIKAWVPADVDEITEKKRMRKYRDDCSRCCKSCADNELLFVAEALEAF